MKKLIYLLCTALVLGSSVTANATAIVDTGPGAGSNTGGWSLTSGQWLAAEFTTGQQYTITDMEGWIGGGLGTATLAIYSDGGSVPGTELFSIGFTAGQSDGWYGATGLAWLLDAGTYWAAFEVRAGDTLSGYMEHPVSTPLGNYAYANSSGWHNDSSLDFGVRISGTQNVPEPTILALMGVGLAGLAFRRRKQAQA